MKDNTKVKDKYGILMREVKNSAESCFILNLLPPITLSNSRQLRKLYSCECTHCEFLMAAILFSARYSE